MANRKTWFGRIREMFSGKPPAVKNPVQVGIIPLPGLKFYALECSPRYKTNPTYREIQNCIDPNVGVRFSDLTIHRINCLGEAFLNWARSGYHPQNFPPSSLGVWVGTCEAVGRQRLYRFLLPGSADIGIVVFESECTPQ